MRQIITNLLSNALKFTPEKGNIYISVNEKAALNNSKSISLIIKIKDTGVGIPEEKLHLIFDRFYQLENSTTGATEGTGIGLSLTKELVKLMSGEITVKSPPLGANKGAEFTLDLPLQKTIDAEENLNGNNLDVLIKNVNGIINEEQNYEMHTGNVKTESALILLVEDNIDVVAYTASCLPDYRLAVAKDGREGFEIATEIIPDLIISDVMMPFMDGFELLKKLRSDEQTSHIPVIMLTAKADMQSKMQGIKGGADAYLEKPFNIEELQIHVQKLLELRKNLQQFYLNKAGLLNNLPAIAPEENLNAEIKISQQTEDKFIIKVREIIETHIDDTAFAVEDLCREVFMSHSKLHRKLDALIGCSPNKFIRIIRLKKAKELLHQSEETISSIALDCGFNDPGYFARV
ncbi:MAG: response regulator, partial [Ignavibacteria bacterium]|nr:response regulator [Ignavibacteria bacterium]